MPDATPLDELMTAWRKLGEEGLTAVRRAFEAGRAQPFAGPAAEATAEGAPPSPHEGHAEHATPPPPPPPDHHVPHDAAPDLRAVLDRLDALDDRLARIEEAIAPLARVLEDGSWLDDEDDEDDDDSDVIPLRAMELRVKGVKRGRKGRKKK